MDTPEQNPPEKSQAQRAQEAYDVAIQQIRSNYQSQFADLRNIQDDRERIRATEALARKAQQELGDKIREATTSAQPGVTDSPETIKEKANNAKKIFLEAKLLKDEKIIVGNDNSQRIVDKIAEKIKSGEMTDERILKLESFLGKNIVDGVVFSQDDQQASDFETNLKNYLQVDQQTGLDIYRTIIPNLEASGTTFKSFNKKIGIDDNPIQQEYRFTGDEEIDMEMMESGYQHDANLYQTRFTRDQKEIIQKFYSPKAFVKYVEDQYNTDSSGKVNAEQVIKEKSQLADKIQKYWEGKNHPLSKGDLDVEVDKLWGEKVQHQINWNVSDVINQLFLELQEKSPHKFYEEIMQEDPFQGPRMIQTKFQAAIRSLMTKIALIEKNDSDPQLAERIKKLKLYRTTADPGYVEERTENPDPNNKNRKLYPRLNPIPHAEKINSLGEFVQFINNGIDHTLHKAEYFHNSRAIYTHPAGEKGFYGQLGGFAESLKGADIDEIMMLPDGKYVMQAYQLYEKMLEEDFAMLDWKHRPDQFTNQLERVNSNIEIEVAEQLRAFYPDFSRDRIQNIVNSGLGIARGVFLTEPEKSAYADAVDSEGRGLVASYSTNDAQSLNVFNPLHNALRWQGEHNWNMMYFMPVEGQKGPWDHKKSWDNMAKYMDSFIVGKGRGTGKEKLPKLFADAMMDINQVGGPNKRKGWRMTYSLDGHFAYDEDNTINGLKTFKAMEAIGYEAIANLVDTDQIDDLLKATDQAQSTERKDMFRYIFKRYFSPDQSKFQESDLDSYLSNLRKDGELEALKNIKENGGAASLKNASWEDQITYETSKLFMKNAKAHYVAARFPTKFLRIERNRFTEDGVSLWEKVYRDFRDRKDDKWDRAKFDLTMKDLTMAEMLFRREISEQIRERIKMDEKWKLHEIDDSVSFRLTKAKIKNLLSETEKGKVFKSADEIQRAVDLWEHIQNELFTNKKGEKNYLDAHGADSIKKYTFTFGLEDTDISLISYRGTGPRMIARAIKDIGGIEQAVTPWMLKMPDVMSEIAVNGKHDFGPIIEYLRTAKKAINDVHGSEAAQEFAYTIAGGVINYFKKDAAAKPLFGLFRLGQRNSNAAEYAGRSNGVWEWDSRDIDRFCLALESYRIVPHNPYDANKTKNGKYVGGALEDRWIKLPFLKNPIKFGKKRHVDFEFNGAKLRREHGADWKAMTWDVINQFLPLAMAFLLWKYIKDAMDEASGKKKQ